MSAMTGPVTEPRGPNNTVAWVLALLAIAAVVAIAVIANGGGKWPESAEQAGFYSCKARGGSAEQCVCVLNALKAHFSYAEVVYANSVLNRTGALPANFTAVLAASGC